MAAAGMPMRTLQAWMGHRDFATTLVYADYSPSEHEAEWIERRSSRPGMRSMPRRLLRRPRPWIRTRRRSSGPANG